MQLTPQRLPRLWLMTTLAAAALAACGGGGGGGGGASSAGTVGQPAPPSVQSPNVPQPGTQTPGTLPIGSPAPSPIQQPSQPPTQPPSNPPSAPGALPSTIGGEGRITLPADAFKPAQAAAIACAPQQGSATLIEPMDPAQCNSGAASTHAATGRTALAALLAGKTLQARGERGQRSWTVPAHASVLDLALPEPAQTLAQRQATAVEEELPNGAVQIGFARDLPFAGQNLVPRLHFAPLGEGGSAAALRLGTAGAAGVATRVEVHAAPAGARFRFTDAAGLQAEEHRSEDLHFDERGVATMYSPFFDGAALRLEIALARSEDVASLDVRVPIVQHLEHSVRSLGAVTPSEVNSEATGKAATDRSKSGTLQAGACHIDSMCAPVSDAQRRAVARMVYQNANGTRYCTGTLINNTANDRTPYFVTANHCISTAAHAASLRTFWFYRSASCNAIQLSSEQEEVGGGAQLLWTDTQLDLTLLKLNRPAPASAVFQGTYTGLHASDELVWGLHHPRGAMQKYSAGRLMGWASCQPQERGFSCASYKPEAKSHHLMTQWADGTTEPGSSGSGLLRNVDGQLYLIGVLTAGTASCSVLDGTDYYGRFDRAYWQGNFARWLRPH